MNIHHYKTSGGKDLIIDYINSLNKNEKVDGYSVLDKLSRNKTDELVIKKWQGKIFEVYFYKHNRMFYVAVKDTDVYILHVCVKQKNKTERTDSDIVIRRAKILGEELSEKFI